METEKKNVIPEAVDPAQVPKHTLYTGCEIPAVGIGTFGSDKYSAAEIAEAVYGAVRGGYRLIDCASVYQNEKEIGGALTRLFEEGSDKRGTFYHRKSMERYARRRYGRAFLPSEPGRSRS